MKVLIVEDNPVDRDILRTILQTHGCETVLEAGDGQQGLELTRAHQPSLIVSDALMPGMDGFQFLRAVKMDPELNKIPFIFYSAVYTGFEEEKLAISLGARAFIVKPKEPEELWRMIDAIVEERGLEQKTPASGKLTRDDEEFIRKYGEIVTAKLEQKIRELEEALARRQTAEEALREQFSAISTIFDAINAVVFVTDIDDRKILFLNDQGCLFFGADWKGKDCDELLSEGRNDAAGMVPTRVLAGVGPPEDYAWEFQNTDTGKWYLCLDRAIPWTDERLVRLTIAIEVTEQKEVERIKSEMISAVSHEMRTPLTTMLGYIELMLSEDVPADKQRKYLKIVHGQTEKLHELIGNFLNLQRLQSRPPGVEGFVPVDVGPIIEEAVRRYRAMSRGYDINVDIPPDLPPVLGDARDLRIMLDNLLSNAIKFSTARPVHVAARREGGDVTILVTDQGIGIPSDLLEQIFHRFYRVDRGNRRRFQGAGLGLALVREIVDAHGGRVWVESTIGSGSTFHVALPVYAGRER